MSTRAETRRRRASSSSRVRPRGLSRRVSIPKQWPTIQQTDLTASGYPVYGANGRIGFYSEYNHEQPTVLLTCRGATCGTVNVCVPKSYVTGNAMALDDLDESTDMGFMDIALPERVMEDDTLRLKRRNIAPSTRYLERNDTSYFRFACDSVFLYEDFRAAFSPRRNNPPARSLIVCQET